MKTYIDSVNDTQQTIEVNLSQQTVNDLKLIAAFHEITVSELIQEYIANSIDNDSRKAKRVEFERNHCKKPNKNCNPNIAAEIRNDSSLMY